MTNQTISIIVPFLNEEENLPLLYKRIVRLFDSLPQQLDLLLIDLSLIHI